MASRWATNTQWNDGCGKNIMLMLAATLAFALWLVKS